MQVRQPFAQDRTLAAVQAAAAGTPNSAAAQNSSNTARTPAAAATIQVRCPACGRRTRVRQDYNDSCRHCSHTIVQWKQRRAKATSQRPDRTP